MLGQELLSEFTSLDFIDILLVSILIYASITVVRQTHTQFIATGFLALSGLYILALTAGLRLTASLFQFAFTVIVVVLVILFQSEVRTFFERLSVWLFPLKKNNVSWQQDQHDLEIICEAVKVLAEQKIGALIVFPQKDKIQRFIQGGTRLDAEISIPILLSIFDPNSSGHDGALIVQNNKLERFMCHLPLSANSKQLGLKGTRHAAALGISEVTDALSLVVSEERGTISLTQKGELQEIDDLTQLPERLSYLLGKILPQNRLTWKQFVSIRDFKFKLIALGMSVILWFFVIFESHYEYRSYNVPIQTMGLADKYELSSIQPPEVRVIVSAPRRLFYFKNAKDFPVLVRLFEQVEGMNEVTLVASDINLPHGMNFENIWPRTVKVKVDKRLKSIKKQPKIFPQKQYRSQP